MLYLPIADPEDIEDPDEMECDPGTFFELRRIRRQPGGRGRVFMFRDRRYLKEFDSLADLKKYINGKDLILSRFGCITITKNGRLKKRRLLDLSNPRLPKAPNAGGERSPRACWI